MKENKNSGPGIGDATEKAPVFAPFSVLCVHAESICSVEKDGISWKTGHLGLIIDSPMTAHQLHEIRFLLRGREGRAHETVVETPQGKCRVFSIVVEHCGFLRDLNEPADPSETNDARAKKVSERMAEELKKARVAPWDAPERMDIGGYQGAIQGDWVSPKLIEFIAEHCATIERDALGAASASSQRPMEGRPRGEKSEIEDPGLAQDGAGAERFKIDPQDGTPRDATQPIVRRRTPRAL